MNFEELLEVLSFEFREPFKRATVFDISGYPHYENVLSNWYAFFLDPAKEHGLEYLFLNALDELLSQKGKTIILDNICIERETGTNNGGRVDILVSDKDINGCLRKAIIIENKVFADTYNDFDDYWKSVDLPATSKVGVLLTLKPADITHSGFINITHAQWCNKIQQLLPDYWQSANDRHLLLLKDFLENIQRITGSQKLMEKELKFLMEHGEKISQLMKLQKEGVQKVFEKLKLGMVAAGWEYNSTNSYTVSFVKPDSSGYSYISIQDLFEKKALRLEFWLRGEDVGTWNTVLDISSLRIAFDEVIMLDEKKQGSTWVRIGRKYLDDLTLDTVFHIEDLIEKVYTEIVNPFVSAVDAILEEHRPNS